MIACYTIQLVATVLHLYFQELFKSIKLGRLADVIYFVNIGANLTPTQGHKESALQSAESSNQSHIVQYLKLNGAENELFSQIWSVMVSGVLTSHIEIII